MEKIKGIVMRTSPKVTVLYTSKSDFIEIPTPKEQPVVGQAIKVNLNPKRLFIYQNISFKYIAVAAVILLVLSISVFSLLFIPNMAVASVALDINNNKGVELSINKDGKIIKVPKVNGDSSILEGISIKGLDIYQTVDLIIENANHKGMLNVTQNLVMASVVPINNKKTQIINTEKLRNTIRDVMTSRCLIGSVVVSQVNQKTQKEAMQQGMTVNGYLIFIRCKNKGIAVQPNALRNDVVKTLMDANVCITSLFPEESFELRAKILKDNSTVARKMPNVPSSLHVIRPSAMNSTENHGYIVPSPKQSPSSPSSPSSSSTSSNGMKPNALIPYPVRQPMQVKPPVSNKSSSGQVSPGSMPKMFSPTQPMSPSYKGKWANKQSGPF